jgi:hypothetical protein
MTTQLIRDVMRDVADAGLDVTEMHWFDISGCFQDKEYRSASVLYDSRPPFPKCAVVWQGSTANYTGFSMWMIVAGDDPKEGILVSAVRCPPGKPPVKSPLLRYYLHEGAIKFGTALEEEKDIDEKDAHMILGFISAWYQVMHQRNTAYVPVVPQTYTNKRKIAKGKAPSYEWRTVVIEAVVPKSEHKGGTHATPRLHDRRGHLRMLSSGKTVWVKPCKVGDPTKGTVWKDYVVQ